MPDGEPSGAAMIYEIRVQGHLPDYRALWFTGMTITRDGCGDTLLTGQVVDQAALYGLLDQLRDLGLPLLSVRRLGQTGNE
jgi:hypothetical protein